MASSNYVRYVLCMLIFWTLSIVLFFKTQRFRDWICLRPQVNKKGRGLNLVGPLEMPVFFTGIALSKGPTRVGPLSFLIT
jgi:hypothetical protein